jgi:hypothetical protein
MARRPPKWSDSTPTAPANHPHSLATCGAGRPCGRPAPRHHSGPRLKWDNSRAPLGSGQAVRLLTLDQVIGGSNPPSPAAIRLIAQPHPATSLVLVALTPSPQGGPDGTTLLGRTPTKFALSCFGAPRTSAASGTDSGWPPYTSCRGCPRTCSTRPPRSREYRLRRG